MRYILIGKRTAITICMLAITVCAALVYSAGQLAQTAAVNASNCPIYSVETEQPLVSLGINCAWGNEDIPQLLDILDAYSVKATFFVVGDWCDKYPDSVKAIHDAGHEIGSHSDTHADMAQLDREGILREIHDSSRKIEALTGQAPILFRPPSGSFNAQVVQVIREEGMYPIQWDCDSIDYKDPSPDEMKVRIMGKVRNGSILLFHSGAKNTPAALPGIIEAIQQEGYRFVPVSELIYQGEYTIDFEGRQHAA